MYEVIWYCLINPFLSYPFLYNDKSLSTERSVSEYKAYLMARVTARPSIGSNTNSSNSYPAVLERLSRKQTKQDNATTADQPMSKIGRKMQQKNKPNRLRDCCQPSKHVQQRVARGMGSISYSVVLQNWNTKEE